MKVRHIKDAEKARGCQAMIVRYKQPKCVKEVKVPCCKYAHFVIGTKAYCSLHAGQKALEILLKE